MTDFNSERYEHNPLQDRSAFRLTTLLPGSHGMPLRCQITEFQGTSNIPYDALSYTWSDDVCSEVIQVCKSVDGEGTNQYIPIRRNLSDALLQLRSDAPRTLWIDALCINQEDLEEKKHQVARMGNVYRGADRVIVWLGKDELYPRTRGLLTQDGRNRWPLTRPESDLGELMTISWFSRVWAVQEYVLARKVFYQLGPLLTPSQDFETVVQRTGTYIDGDKKLYDQWKSLLRLFEYRKLIQKRELGAVNPQLTLVRVFLDLTRSRSCKDSRDRIYGILGIFKDTTFVPDYTIPTRQVYQNFVSQNLEAGEFSILHECCIGIAEPDEQSYVPFFGQSRSKSTYVPFASPSALYCAGLHHPSSVSVGDDKLISIQGYFVDEVTEKLDFAEDCKIQTEPVLPGTVRLSTETPQLPLQGTWGAIYQMIMNQLVYDPAEHLRWREDFEENRLAPQFAMAPYSFNNFFDVLVRAMRTDLNPEYDWISTKGRIRPDAHLHRSRRELLQERSLFRTKSGFIGSGTCHMQSGDEVVVFNGDTTPFLLRKDGCLDGTDTNVYRIVSDCYLCGWMYGPFPDKTVEANPSRRLRVANKLRGSIGSSSGKEEIRPHVPPRTFIVS